MVALKPEAASAARAGEGGSRNAVVALKLRRSRFCFRFSSRKQERRGGIETDQDHPRPQLHIGKQERRGGIETPYVIDVQPYPATEAGTPWWH